MAARLENGRQKLAKTALAPEIDFPRLIASVILPFSYVFAGWPFGLFGDPGGDHFPGPSPTHFL